MSKPTLVINFADFWMGFNKEDNMFIHLLRNKYDVRVGAEPDILFYSCYSNNFLDYDCPKIYYTAENTRPDFKECDFAFSFDLGLPAAKHYRLPLYRWNGELEKLTSHKNAAAIFEQKTKFCCMLVSNPNCKERNIFFEKLSRYKKVDSGGRHLNNLGYKVDDKMQFIQDYKFVLSFENTSHAGYTTEKLIEPMFANSVAVYWGNSQVGNDFNAKSFVNVHDYETFDAAIEDIVWLDNDNHAYIQKLQEPYFKNNRFPAELEYKQIEDVLVHTVEKLKGKEGISKKYKGHSKLKIAKQNYNKLKRRVILWSR